MIRYFAALLLAGAGYAHGQTPARPIRVIAPFPPGSAGDIIPRAIGPDASAALKQNMIIDNRPGAAGSIAAEIVARAASDGHTLLFGTTGVLAINPWLYKVTTNALSDLMSGRVHVMFASFSSSIPFAKSGKIRMLAITGGQRHPAMPDIPTVREAAVPEYEVTGFFGYLAPAGTPANVIRRLNETLTAVINTREVTERLAGLGADASTSTPEEFAALIRSELAKWARAVKASGVQMQ